MLISLLVNKLLFSLAAITTISLTSYYALPTTLTQEEWDSLHNIEVIVELKVNDINHIVAPGFNVASSGYGCSKSKKYLPANIDKNCSILKFTVPTNDPRELKDVDRIKNKVIPILGPEDFVTGNFYKIKVSKKLFPKLRLLGWEEIHLFSSDDTHSDAPNSVKHPFATFLIKYQAIDNKLKYKTNLLLVKSVSDKASHVGDRQTYESATCQLYKDTTTQPQNCHIYPLDSASVGKVFDLSALKKPTSLNKTSFSSDQYFLINLTKHAPANDLFGQQVTINMRVKANTEANRKKDLGNFDIIYHLTPEVNPENKQPCLYVKPQLHPQFKEEPIEPRTQRPSRLGFPRQFPRP